MFVLQCTLENPPSATRCEVCSAPQPRSTAATRDQNDPAAANEQSETDGAGSAGVGAETRAGRKGKAGGSGVSEKDAADRNEDSGEVSESKRNNGKSKNSRSGAKPNSKAQDRNAALLQQKEDQIRELQAKISALSQANKARERPNSAASPAAKSAKSAASPGAKLTPKSAASGKRKSLAESRLVQLPCFEARFVKQRRSCTTAAR